MDELQDTLGLGDNEFAKYVLTHDVEVETRTCQLLAAIWEQNLEHEDEFSKFMMQDQYSGNGINGDVFLCEWGPYRAELFLPMIGDGEYRITKGGERRKFVTDRLRAFGPGVDTPVYLPDGTPNPKLFDGAVWVEE